MPRTAFLLNFSKPVQTIGNSPNDNDKAILVDYSPIPSRNTEENPETGEIPVFWDYGSFWKSLTPEEREALKHLHNLYAKPMEIRKPFSSKVEKVINLKELELPELMNVLLGWNYGFPELYNDSRW